MRRFEATVTAREVEPALPAGETRGFLRSLAARLVVPHTSVAVVFGDDEMMREMNQRYRGKDHATDVLSFPSGDPDHLGDIAISSPTVTRQAHRRGHTPAREARILLIHGFLHLLGYDHESDDGEMDALEATLRADLLSPGDGRG